MTVSRRLRFEILRRDRHRCRYCGATAPDVHLTVDHVIPVTLGGTDEPSNLVAACVDCNNGKSSVPTDAALVADVNAFALQWATAMRSAGQMQQASREADQAICDQFLDIWKCYDEKEVMLPHDWDISVMRWVRSGLTPDDFLYVIDAAMRSQATARNVFRYTAGVTRNLLIERAQLAHELIAQGTA